MRQFEAVLDQRDREKLNQSKRDWATQQSHDLSEKLHSWLTDAAHSTSPTVMVKKEQSRWKQTNEKIFASAMKMTLQGILESEQQAGAFVSLHLHNEQLLLFLKPYLTPKQAKQIAKLMEAEKRRLEIVAIETYIFGGTPEDDDEFRRKIDEILSCARSEASPVIEAAFQKALSESESQETLFRRFAKSSNRVAQPVIEELKVTNSIFESLPLETQMDFFRVLMKFHDLPLKDHPVCDFACTTTKKLLPRNGKRPGFNPTKLQRAVLCFMTLHDERSKYVKKQVAQWLLGGGEVFNIDKYLCDYEYKRLRLSGTAQPKAVTKQPEVAESLMAKARRIFWRDADD
jgi:hypothetical protein